MSALAAIKWLVRQIIKVAGRYYGWAISVFRKVADSRIGGGLTAIVSIVGLIVFVAVALWQPIPVLPVMVLMGVTLFVAVNRIVVPALKLVWEIPDSMPKSQQKEFAQAVFYNCHFMWLGIILLAVVSMLCRYFSQWGNDKMVSLVLLMCLQRLWAIYSGYTDPIEVVEMLVFGINNRHLIEIPSSVLERRAAEAAVIAATPKPTPRVKSTPAPAVNPPIPAPVVVASIPDAPPQPKALVISTLVPVVEEFEGEEGEETEDAPVAVILNDKPVVVEERVVIPTPAPTKLQPTLAAVLAAATPAEGKVDAATLINQACGIDATEAVKKAARKSIAVALRTHPEGKQWLINVAKPKQEVVDALFTSSETDFIAKLAPIMGNIYAKRDQYAENFKALETIVNAETVSA